MMGKWSENEEKMEAEVRDEIIKALWQQLAKTPNTELEKIIEKFFVIKVVLGLMKIENDQYVPTEDALRLDKAIRNNNFDEFKKAFEKIPYKPLAEIKMHESLVLAPEAKYNSVT